MKSIVTLTPKVRRQRTELVTKLVNLKAEAMSLGLIKTHHALDDAATVVGWEIAEHERK